MNPPRFQPGIYSEARRLRFLGAGGMGMAPLAVYLRRAGFSVVGEDDHFQPAVRGMLEREDVIVVEPDGQWEGIDLVVRSSAVPDDHPAVLRARTAGLPVLRRGEMLARAVAGRRLVAVCGSHGKTTTAALLIAVLEAAGFEADYILGGLFEGDDRSPAAARGSEWVVAEIDESDGTIEAFSPEITVLVNLDWDHPERYRDPNDIEEAFRRLLGRSRSRVLYSSQCPASQRLAAALPSGKALSVGPGGHYSWTSAGSQSMRLGDRFPVLELDAPGQGDFNRANAAMALAAAAEMDVSPRSSAFAAFPGVRRRQTCLYRSDSVEVWEDYAHHPSEVSALLDGPARGPGRTVVVYQPHRYTRTAALRVPFAEVLARPDLVLLLDVYAAGESPVEGGLAGDLFEELRRRAGDRAAYLPGKIERLAPEILRRLQPGDRLWMVGAGDIDGLARAVVAALPEEQKRWARWNAFEREVGKLSAETRVRRHEMLAPKTTLRVGGPAWIYAEPADPEDLQAILRAARVVGIPVYLLGRGSNLIVPDDGVDGVVIRLQHSNWHLFEPMSDGRVRVGAGLRLKQLCGRACRAGLDGFEFLEGIPGTVGGALRMNAGAMGGWMYDVVDEVVALDAGGDRRVWRREELDVGYRHCAQLAKAIAVEAVLRPAARAESSVIRDRMAAFQSQRHETQPREPSAGCIFKNPAGTSAGRLIEEAGLKGRRIGDAEISSVHANFIINRGRATGEDVLALVREVRREVRAHCGVDLEPEVLLYGHEWKEVL